MKFRNVTGINLSSKRQYSSDNRLYYDVAGHKRICGSGGRMPAVASKISEAVDAPHEPPAERADPVTGRSRPIPASRSRVRRGVGAALGAALLTVSGAACAQGSGEVGGVPTDGPLWVTAGVGGSTLRPPAEVDGPWSGTFGGFVMCRKDGSRITLDKVVPQVKAPARRLNTFVRTVAPARPSSRRARSSHIPVTSSLGSAPDFAEPYVRHAVPGTFTRALDDVAVTGRCKEGVGRAPSDGYQELMFTMSTGSPGAHVKSFTIYYTAGGQQYAYPVAWQMGLCGERISKEICPPRH